MDPPVPAVPLVSVNDSETQTDNVSNDTKSKGNYVMVTTRLFDFHCGIKCTIHCVGLKNILQVARVELESGQGNIFALEKSGKLFLNSGKTWKNQEKYLGQGILKTCKNRLAVTGSAPDPS